MNYIYFIVFLGGEAGFFFFFPASIPEFVCKHPGGSIDIGLFLSNNECIGETVVIGSWAQFLTKKH